MTKFVLIPESFSGNISFIYNGAGLLMEFCVNSWDIAGELHVGVLHSLRHCLTDAQLLEFAKKHAYKIRREQIDLSFERFKIMYGIARDTFRAEPLWNKMKEKEQYHTLINLKAYKRFCKRNPTYIQMYPAAYLRAHTKDDWDKVPDFK